MKRLPILIAFLLFAAVSGLVAALVVLLMRHRHEFPREVLREVETALRDHPGVRLDRMDALEEKQASAENRRINPESSARPCAGLTLRCVLETDDVSELTRLRMRLKDSAILKRHGMVPHFRPFCGIQAEGDPQDRFECVLLRTCPEPGAPPVVDAR